MVAAALAAATNNCYFASLLLAKQRSKSKFVF
jgi:hypothetical protein